MPRQARQSITDKRKKDAERQARLRTQKRKARIPETHEMQRVMLEAFSFAWQSRRMALGREGMPLEVRQFW